MFHLAKNVLSSRNAWVPVLQRCFSAVALSDHKQVRTMECQNGEKVRRYCKVQKETILIIFSLKSCTVLMRTDPCPIYSWSVNPSLRRRDNFQNASAAFEFLYGGQFTLSTQLIKPNYLRIYYFASIQENHCVACGLYFFSWQCYTCQLFVRYKRAIFILGVLGFLKTTRSFPKILEEFRNLSKKSEVFRSLRTRINASSLPVLFTSKIRDREEGIAIYLFYTWFSLLTWT